MRATSKSPDAFRTISEVANDLDVPQHVLRFWETKFAQVKPLKRAGGRRYYRPEDLNLLRGIRTLLYTDGFTIKGVQKVLREQGIRYVMETGRMVGRDDRPLPVTHSGSLAGSLEGEISNQAATVHPDLSIEPSEDEAENFEETSFEDAQINPDLTIEPVLETPIIAPKQRVMADQPIESIQPKNSPGLSARQRSALESILEELLELKFNLGGAKKTLGKTSAAVQQDFLSDGEIPHVA